jgi:DNA processing protein
LRCDDAGTARAGRSDERIELTAGVDFDTAMRCLGELAAGGFVERSERGWRIRPLDTDEG